MGYTYRPDNDLDAAVFDAEAKQAKAKMEARIALREKKQREKDCKKTGGHFFEVEDKKAYSYRYICVNCGAAYKPSSSMDGY